MIIMLIISIVNDNLKTKNASPSFTLSLENVNIYNINEKGDDNDDCLLNRFMRTTFHTESSLGQTAQRPLKVKPQGVLSGIGQVASSQSSQG